MPTKIYRIKMNDFWINVSYSSPHYPRSKNKEIASAKNEINAFKSQVQFQAIKMSESLRGGKGAVSVILEKGLVVI